jgi:hypothetical protein
VHDGRLVVGERRLEFAAASEDYGVTDSFALDDYVWPAMVDERGPSGDQNSV